MPDPRQNKFRFVRDSRSGRNFFDQDFAVNSKAAQIVVVERSVAAMIVRTRRDVTISGRLNRTRVKSAFAEGTNRPFGRRRLLHENAPCEQAFELAPEMWLSLSAPKRCGFARLTEPQ